MIGHFEEKRLVFFIKCQNIFLKRKKNMQSLTLHHQMTNAQARLRMSELKAEWQKWAFLEWKRMHRWAENLMNYKVADLSANDMFAASDYKQLGEIADGSLHTEDCTHEMRLKTKFMEWLRKNHKDEWRVVALWVDEEVRQQDVELWNQEFEKGEPDLWRWDHLKLVDEILV